jgi:hypothetical protein
MLCDKCEKTEGPVCASCSEERNKEIEDLQGYGVDLIDRTNEKIRVRWDVYNRYEINAGVYRKMNRLLLSLRVFSRDLSRNWIILAGYALTGICIEGYYFTQKEDALEYFRKRYGNPDHSRMVLHISEAYRR